VIIGRAAIRDISDKQKSIYFEVILFNGMNYHSLIIGMASHILHSLRLI